MTIKYEWINVFWGEDDKENKGIHLAICDRSHYDLN